MVSVFHLFRRRLLLPVQIFLGVFILGVWFVVPKIEKDLTQRAKEVIRKLELEDKVRVSFYGPVASLSGKVEDAGTKQKLIDQIGSMVSVWGLQVENQQALVVTPPPIPVTYRLDFANRQIKVSGSVPGVPGGKRFPGGISYVPSGFGRMRRILPRKSPGFAADFCASHGSMPFRLSIGA